MCWAPGRRPGCIQALTRGLASYPAQGQLRVQGQLLAAGLRWQWAYFPQWIGANSAQRWIWRGFGVDLSPASFWPWWCCKSSRYSPVSLRFAPCHNPKPLFFYLCQPAQNTALARLTRWSRLHIHHLVSSGQHASAACGRVGGRRGARSRPTLGRAVHRAPTRARIDPHGPGHGMLAREARPKRAHPPRQCQHQHSRQQTQKHHQPGHHHQGPDEPAGQARQKISQATSLAITPTRVCRSGTRPAPSPDRHRPRSRSWAGNAPPAATWTGGSRCAAGSHA